MTEISLLPVSGIYLEQFYSVFYFFSHSDTATREWYHCGWTCRENCVYK